MNQASDEMQKIQGKILHFTPLRANEEMACTELLSNPTNIKCQLLVSKDPGDKWDLSVATDDGAEVILRDAFGINKLDVETGSGGTSQSRIV